jgi:hypothetical protein
MMDGSISPVAADDAPTIINAGKYEGASFADLDFEELVALRRDPDVPRAAIEREIWRRRMVKRRTKSARTFLWRGGGAASGRRGVSQSVVAADAVR